MVNADSMDSWPMGEALAGLESACGSWKNECVPFRPTLVAVLDFHFA